MNILYTAPGCPYCMIIKRFLESNNIKFKEIDISKDKKSFDVMKKISGQENVPVTDINGTIIVGYDLKRLKGALNLK